MTILGIIYGLGYFGCFVTVHMVAARQPWIRGNGISIPTTRIALRCLIWPLLCLGVAAEMVAERLK